jgi:ribosomal protein S18 acetylase RimI-like enzyme
LKIALDPGEDVAEAVEAGLKAFNIRAVNTGDPIPVQVSVRDDAGAIVGGIVGRVWMDGLYMSTVWVDDTLRGQGHGRAMMEAAEAEGRRHGATHSWLHTLSWQARPFYESLGYACIGEMPLGGGKHRRYFMRKDLS